MLRYFLVICITCLFITEAEAQRPRPGRPYNPRSQNPPTRIRSPQSPARPTVPKPKTTPLQQNPAVPITTQRRESLDIAGWTELAPSAAGFSVYLPEPTEEQKQTISVGNGRLELTKYVLSKDVNGAYVVMYSDLRADRMTSNDQVFRAARDRVVGTLDGRLLDENSVQTGDTTGREVQVQTRDGTIVRERMFVLENRFYQVIAAGRPEFAKSLDVQKYFRSFRLSSHAG